ASSIFWFVNHNSSKKGSNCGAERACLSRITAVRQHKIGKRKEIISISLLTIINYPYDLNIEG
ncbi:MAG: hypothetical protein QXR45_12365, partial [Candidatus Bathyarchaeia archaeon]